MTAENSIYEKNWVGQVEDWKRILQDPLLPNLVEYLQNSTPQRVIFVGIGSSFWASQLSEFLWREHLGLDAVSIQSYDFVRSKYCLKSSSDFVVIFSHRGWKSFSVDSIKVTKQHGCKVLLITGIGGAKQDTDFRLETCTQEAIGAFTISLTTALVRVIQMIGVLNANFVKKFRDYVADLKMPMNINQFPKFPQKLTIIGDAIREPIAGEINLKIAEMAYLQVRSYGLEEWLHGIRISQDKTSSVILLASKEEPRTKSAIKFVEAVGADLIVIEQEDLTSVQEFGWMSLLLWGQGMSLKICQHLKVNPDTCRNDDPLYDAAKKQLQL